MPRRESHFVPSSASATLPEVRLQTDQSGMSRLALTVIAHPCLQRIGEIAWIDAETDNVGGIGEFALSRMTPGFGRPRESASRPLEHRSLSRSPILLRRREDGGIDIAPHATGRSVLVDGEAVTGVHTYDVDRLRSGLVLLLSRRVVLLLHPITTVALDTPHDLGMIGESSGILEARNEIVAASRSGNPVLVRGATGTGKELVAKAIHEEARPDGPLISVNMAAIPSDLAASELFGTQADAFTGVRRNQPGRIRQAHQGVLFLDEIGDAPLEVQVSLLRVLDERTVMPLGGTREEPVDFLLVAATDRDLEHAVAQGTFRDALYHRLRGHLVYLPPLQQRREDLGRLLVGLLHRELARSFSTAALPDTMALPNGDAGGDWLPAEMVAELMLRPWSGNVRALSKVAEQIVVSVRQTEGQANPAHIAGRVARYLATEDRVTPDSSRDTAAAPAHAASRTIPPIDRPPVAAPDSVSRSPDLLRPSRRQPAELRAQEIQAAMVQYETMSEAADALAISRASLYRRSKQLGLPTPASFSRPFLREKLASVEGDVARLSEILGVNRQALVLRLSALGLLA